MVDRPHVAGLSLFSMKIFILNGLMLVHLVEMGRQRVHFNLILQEVACANVRDFAESCMCLGRVVLESKFLETDVLKESSQPCQEPHLSNSSAHERRGKCSVGLFVASCCNSWFDQNAGHILRHPFVQKAFGAIWSLGSLGPQGPPIRQRQFSAPDSVH